MGILYVKKAYERLTLKERLANINTIFSCLSNTTEFQSDVLLSMILPTLKNFNIPNYLDKQKTLLPSIEDKAICKKIFNYSLKVILMPYLPLTDKSCWKDQASLSDTMISGILTHVPTLDPDSLEGAKHTLVNLVSCEAFTHHAASVVALLVAAQADTRCKVSDAAESRSKRLRNSVNWEDEGVVVLLYGMFLGHDKLPAKVRHLCHGFKAGNLRLRMKLLPVLALSTYAANLFPLNIQVVFGGLFGEDANKQLNLSAVTFIHKICEDASDTVLKTIGGMLKQGLLKSIQSTGVSDLKLCGRLYLGLGKLSLRCPDLFSSDVYLLSLLFSMLEQEDKDLITDLKEGLFLMTGAYKSVLGTENELKLEELLLKHINKVESSPCTAVALRFSNMLHPTSHLPSRYLCLLALGSGDSEVVDEARAGLRGSEHDKLPGFEAAVGYIGKCTEERLNTPAHCYIVGTQKLPYIPLVYSEVLKFTRQCLDEGTPDHIVLDSERYKFLRNRLTGMQQEGVVEQYRRLLKTALVPAAPATLQALALLHLVELSASLPETLTDISYEWCEGFLASAQYEVRCHSASLVGLLAHITTSHHVVNGGRQHGAERTAGLDREKVDMWSSRLLKMLAKANAKFEEIDGGVLAAGYLAPCTSTDLAAQLMGQVIRFLDTGHITGVCMSLKHCCYNVDIVQLVGQDSAQKLHQRLVTLISQTKEQKILIPLSESLGALHLHSSPLPRDEALGALLGTAKRNLLQLNFAVGKTLAVLSSGVGSPPTVCDVFVNLVDNTRTQNTTTTQIILEKIVREFVLGDVRDIELQAASVWLLSILKYLTDMENIVAYKTDIQHALSVLLSNKDTLTQEIASEALSLLYTSVDPSTKSHLVDMLRSTLLNETVQHKHVAMDTKIFSAEDLGKLPSSMGGGNLTTYKELCSLASDMNQPEMIYQFMHLSNNSSLWTDRLGAAFGVGHLVKSAGKELEPHLSSIIPRIFRYQFDPNLKVQQSMSNIWSLIVPKPKETVDKYLSEILSDLKGNIHHTLWRTRESCSNALGEVVRTRSYSDLILSEIPCLWDLILKLMDDIKESVRQSAAKTAEVLSKISVSVCKVEDGARGARAISTILPVLLDSGITSRVVEVQTVAIVTVMKISDNAGPLLAPHVSVIVPAFISASANIEPKALGHITTMVSGSSEDKDKVEQARAHLAITSPLVPVIDKCIRECDLSELDTLVPRLSSLSKTAVGLTPRVTLLHTVSLLAVYKQQDLTGWVGKLMGAVFGILTDRSLAVRDKCSATVALLFRYAKASTVDNVMERLKTWYLEKEDDIRLLVSQIVYKLSNTAPDVLRSVHGSAVPLTLFGRHSDKEVEKAKWEEVWSELGISDQSVTLTYLTEISDLCSATLQSTSWNNRIQAAKTLSTIAVYLNTSYPEPHFSTNIATLLQVSGGRTFPGKSAILSAISTTLTAVGKLRNVDESAVLEVFLREFRKGDKGYVGEVMRTFGDLILGMEVTANVWDEVWEICTTHLTPPVNEEEVEEGKECHEKKKTVDTFSIDQPIQESSILLLGVSWRICQTPCDRILEVSQFMSGLMRLCSWNLRLSVLGAMQHILGFTTGTSSSDTLEPHVRTAVYEVVIPSVLRCVDDTKHASVRGLALQITLRILQKCGELQLVLSRGTLDDILTHVRDQISNENNLNIKSRGIEIVTIVEKSVS